MLELTIAWKNVADCQSFSEQLAAVIHEPLCITLDGTLGAGKTQFTRCFVGAMHGDVSLVSSPTFVLVHQYAARIPITHLDLYRLERAIELDGIGFDDLLNEEAVCLIEWSNKFTASMPEDRLQIEISHECSADHASLGDTPRKVCLKAKEHTVAHRILQAYIDEYIRGNGE